MIAQTSKTADSNKINNNKHTRKHTRTHSYIYKDERETSVPNIYKKNITRSEKLGCRLYDNQYGYADLP